MEKLSSGLREVGGENKMTSMKIKDVAELDALYGAASPRSIAKEINYLNFEYQSFIEASPLMTIATVGREGLDCSPRGDKDGVVRVINSTTIRFADRKGNNRLDTLRNIIEDDRIALLFLVPGVGETMRVNGRAVISTSPELLEAFTMDGKPPKTVIEVKVESVYFQCSKALLRAGIWSSDLSVACADVPSAGAMLKAVIDDDFDANEYDKSWSESQKGGLW